MTASDRTPGTPEYAARLQRARDNLTAIREYRRALGYPVSDDATAERIAEDIARAPRLAPDTGRRIARLLGGGRHG